MDRYSEEEGLTAAVAPPEETSGPKKLRRLCALDTFFRGSGVAVLRFRQGGREVTYEIPIKSVDNEEADAIVKPYRPKPPIDREYINNKWVSVVNEAKPEYQDKLTEYNRRLSLVWILLGLDIDVVDAQGQVVWSADNTVKHFDQAREALKQMGIVDGQIIQMMQAIRNLTTDEREIQEGE